MTDKIADEQVLSMTSGEAVAIVDLFRERMARGWIPDAGDIARALAQLRRPTPKRPATLRCGFGRTG